MKIPFYKTLSAKGVPSRNVGFLVNSGCTSYAVQVLKCSIVRLKGGRSVQDKNLAVYAVTSVSCGLGLQNDLCTHQLTLLLMNEFNLGQLQRHSLQLYCNMDLESICVK